MKDDLKNKSFKMNELFKHREVTFDDFVSICSFPQNETELYFCFPKAVFPLTVDQLSSSIDNRFDSTVIIVHNTIAGFANFYEAEKDKHCSIGNVIINPLYRGKGVGEYLIKTMEDKAIKKYNVKEIHISCFNANVAGLLLYNKLGYCPYEIEKRFDKHSVPVAMIKLRKIIRR
jgi:ribosomal protein S18 acetylase RimI-like enzyme